MISKLLDRLSQVRKLRDGVWQARCPGHSDRTPSLRVRELDNGHILIHCFAGCGAIAVMEAIGLSLSDLYPERGPDARPNRKPYMPQDVLSILQHEANRLLILGSDCEHGNPDKTALTDCVDRIETISRMSYGR